MSNSCSRNRSTVVRLLHKLHPLKCGDPHGAVETTEARESVVPAALPASYAEEEAPNPCNHRWGERDAFTLGGVECRPFVWTPRRLKEPWRDLRWVCAGLNLQRSDDMTTKSRSQVGQGMRDGKAMTKSKTKRLQTAERLRSQIV